MKEKIKTITGIRKYRNFVCIISCLLFAGNIFSQDSSVITARFETFNAYNYQEKVFLHTDKTVYVTGEILWFKCYITDAASNKLSALSKICYVEVIGNDKRKLLQAKISIDTGTGNGSFTIPSSIRTGNYLIRAYTNWMKNFDPAFYFEQSVSIINPGKKPDVVKSDSVKNYSIQFFPEGGNLLYGLSSKTAFKIADRNGKGVSANGIITDEKNDTIIHFESERFGMGTFEFTPVEGHTYKAVTKVGDKIFINDLPKIYDRGWAFQVKDEGSSLHVAVASNIETEHSVYLFAQTRGVFKLAKTQFLKKGAADFVINKSDLDEGISQFTLFNENKQPVCERLYFKRPTQFLQIKIDNAGVDLQKRKKVEVHVASSGPVGKPVKADMSVSVYLLDSLQPAQEINIVNYLWLSSEIRGNIESPQYYFDNTGPEVDRAMDNLMLTQGWRRFKWDDVLKNAKPSFAFLPEVEGHLITGKLIPGNAAIPDTGITTYVSVPGNNFKFATATSASGLVKFNIEKFYGGHELITQVGLVDSNYRIAIDNPFSENFSEYNIKPILLVPDLKNEILTRSIGAQSKNTYQPGNIDHYVLPQTFDSIAFFGFPSKTYYLDNYTRFHTMEEVMREYVNEVHVKNRQNTFHYEVYNELQKLYFSEDPLVLIDGVPVFNINKIMEIDPLKIKKIDITTNRFFLGAREYEGIVSYSTYDGDLQGYDLSPGSLVVEYDGLQLEREFYSPQYETPEQFSSRIPDMRNVLYWSPHLKTVNGKQDISFYTSDVPGNYLVLVQGISDRGLVGTGVVKFMINR